MPARSMPARPLRVCTVVGARPQFVKAAMLSRALRAAGVDEVLVHTGQHYDVEMDRIFFEELELPEPAVNLGVGSGTHAEQTGDTMIRLERYLLEHEHPDVVVVFGDTNGTLAAVLVAAKLHLPLAHVEAGLRSFNRCMPEEINRIVADRLSDLCFCPNQEAVEQLRREGITQGVYCSGDVMLDATLHYADCAAERAPLASLTHHAAGAYAVATVHRPANTDNAERLRAIFDGFGRLDMPVLVPLHPRTRTRMNNVPVPDNVQLRPPARYLAMLTLVRNAHVLLTDSGGLQKEAYWLGTPCVTLRDETEWTATLEGGWNHLAGASTDAIVEAAAHEPEGPRGPLGEAADGSPSEFVVRRLLEHGADDE